MKLEATTGVEPVNGGFANLCLRPLGYVASAALELTPREGAGKGAQRQRRIFPRSRWLAPPQLLLNSRVSLTVAIITLNEAERIERVLKSAPVADELLVLDSGSTDGTVELARSLGARVVEEAWRGYGPQKNRALELARGEWVLSLDADEVVTPELRGAVEAVIAEPADGVDGYSVLRRNWWRDAWVRRGVYGPRKKVRLVRTGAGRWVGGALHETLEVGGRVEALDGFLDHYPYDSVEEFEATSRSYAKLFAEKGLAEGRRSRWWDRQLRPPLHLIKALLLQGGALEGAAGLQLARLGAAEVAMKWRELAKAERDGK